jgi:hypothetical protein
MSRSRKTKWVGGEEYFRLLSGKWINISEVVRIYLAVEAAEKPGMSKVEHDALVADTVKRMSAN